MDYLTIPAGYKVSFESMDDEGYTRIEATQAPHTFGEVAYWNTDGTNDIMQGETGTLIQAAQALVNFAAGI